MTQAAAVAALHKLTDRARLGWGPTDELGPAKWREQVRTALCAAIGPRSDLVARLDELDFGGSARSSAASVLSWQRNSEQRQKAIQQTLALIGSVELQIELASDRDQHVEAINFDPELWEHVRRLVESQDWAKIAAETVIFVEHKLRRWLGTPRSKTGAKLFGKAIFLSALGDSAPMELGDEQGEHEGWKYLGMGLALAIGNVDRHGIQNRDDARRYAVGVLGLASLILTQIKYEHLEVVNPPAGPRRGPHLTPPDEL